jgi:RNA polymerase sigma-70 factor (ECF subfamily)
VNVLAVSQPYPAAVEEAGLVARLAGGDRDEPLAELYARYGSRVFGLGLRLLGDRGLAEELVQDTFVRLWRSAGRFDPGRGTVRTFVFMLARRAAVDLLRRPASRPLAGRDAPAPVTDDVFEALVVGIDVRAALDALPEKHAEVLRLAYDEGLTQVQISERLGVPLGTVKTRAYYALRALRLELEERGIGV